MIKPPSIYVKDTEIKGVGLGVYAARDYAEGEVVEESPIVVFDPPFRQLPEPFRLRVVDWGHLAGTKPCSALALGYGSLYNTADPANLQYSADKDKNLM